MKLKLLSNVNPLFCILRDNKYYELQNYFGMDLADYICDYVDTFEYTIDKGYVPIGRGYVHYYYTTLDNLEEIYNRRINIKLGNIS